MNWSYIFVYTCFLNIFTIFGRVEKEIISLTHSSLLFSYVLYLIISSSQNKENMKDSLMYSLSYLITDSFVKPRKRLPSIYIHHVLVSVGELYSLYNEAYIFVFYSYLGEIFSVFLHLRKFVPKYRKYSECCMVISFLVTRIILPLYIWYCIYIFGDIVSLLFYSSYVMLNMYWGSIIMFKLKKKLSFIFE